MRGYKNREETHPTGRGNAHTVRGAPPYPRPALPGALTNWCLAGAGATSALHRRGGRCRGGRGSSSGEGARSRHKCYGCKAPAAAAAASPAVPPLGDSNGPERRLPPPVTARGSVRPARAAQRPPRGPADPRPRRLQHGAVRVAARP